jgi:hypothetical protein
VKDIFHVVRAESARQLLDNTYLQQQSYCVFYAAWLVPRLYSTVTPVWRRGGGYHENEHVRGIGQGEARHRKYKRLKLGGGQAYDRSND